MVRRRFNRYGYWQFTDVIPLSNGIEQGDVVFVFSSQRDMVNAYTTSGKTVSFHVTNLTKEYFERPGRGHAPAKCLAKGMYGVDCPNCVIFRAKKKLKKVLVKYGVKT